MTDDEHDDAWANFLAQLNPAALEQERMRVHGDLDRERPGSREDHEMRFAHDFIRAERSLLETETEEARQERHEAKQNADADREIHARGYDRIADNEHQLEAAIRSYSQRHHERHAA